MNQCVKRLVLSLFLLSFQAMSADAHDIIKQPTGLDQHKVQLGKLLYFDPRLSRSGYISCNTCHNLSLGGVDNLPKAIGHQWRQVPVNTPTVLNSRYNFAQNWDGRSKDLQAQIEGPVTVPVGMASTHKLVTDVVSSIPDYKQAFKRIYRTEAITFDHVTDAIATFEETLVTPDSAFDRWTQGDKSAMTPQQQRGYDLFKETGCMNCHNGPAFGGTGFQKMGVVKPYKTESKAVGRFKQTKNPADKFVFKVPLLTNIELTYPYFHDGAVWSLEEAVSIMADIQLNKQLSQQEVSDITAFLKALTGKPVDIDVPFLPPSTASTPRPNRL